MSGEDLKDMTPGELIKSLKEDLTKLQADLARHRWILVKERLPDGVITVWILLYASATHSLHPGEGFYGEDENGWGWTVLGDTLLTEVFAWKLFDRDNYPALPEREGY